MSINFYSTLDNNTLLAKLTLANITNYAHVHHLKQINSGPNQVFVMTWKIFIDMVRESMASDKKNQNLNFINIKDSPDTNASVLVPIQEKPLFITQASGTNAITSDIAHIPEDALVIITFKKQMIPKTIEGFSTTCKQMTTTDYLVFIVGIVLVVYLIYYVYTNQEPLFGTSLD